MAVAFASQTLTVTGQPLNTETVTVGGKVYTFQTVLTNVDGNVFIGATAAASLQNLKDAVNLTGTPGTQYAAATAANPDSVADTITATTLIFRSRVAGTVGNRNPSTETLTNGSFGAATFAGGTGSIDTDLRALIASSQINASVLQQMIDIIDPEANE
jgi:hypothetical protein